jgi:hypothetical protein
LVSNSSDINAWQIGPIGPQKTKEQRQITQNTTLDEPEMMNDIQEIDHLSIETGPLHKVMDSSDSDDNITDSSDPNFHAQQIARKFKKRCRDQKNKQLLTLVKIDQ